MRRITGVVVSLAVALGGVGLAKAGPVRPVFHEEAERLFDEAADQLRSLGARVEQHMQLGSPYAGGSGAMPGHGGGMLSPAERPLITLMLQRRQELGLTPDQVARLETLRGEFTREAIRRDADIRIAELDLAALLDPDPLDMAKVEAKIRALAELRADLRIARIRVIEQGKAVLTAEQRARLQGVLGGGGPGPRPSAAVRTQL